MAPEATRKYGASSRPSPAKSTSPKAARKKPKHPLDLYHLIPPPDSSDDSDNDGPGPAVKRRKAEDSPVASKNGPRGQHEDRRANPATKRKRRSLDRDREIPDSPNGARANPPKKRKGGREAAADNDNASSSDNGSYRAIPVSTSPRSFNSNNIRSGKRALDYSPIEEPSDYPASDDEPPAFNFSSQPLDKKKGGKEPISSRFVYDDVSDMSSGEETSIPGTIPHSGAMGKGAQKVPGREPSEVGETERDLAESLDTESDEDLGERSPNAAKYSQAGASKLAESGGSSQSDYESAEDGSKHLSRHHGSSQGSRMLDVEAEESSDESEDEAPPSQALKKRNVKAQKPIRESSTEQSSSSESEEEQAKHQTSKVLGAKGSGGDSSEEQSSSGDFEEEPPQTSKAAKATAAESDDGSTSDRSNSSDSEEENPRQGASKESPVKTDGASSENTGGQNRNGHSDINAKPTRKTAEATEPVLDRKSRASGASQTRAQPKLNGDASAKKKTPAKSQPTTRGKKPPATPASTSQPSSQTSARRNGKPNGAPSSSAKVTPEVLGRLTSREEQTLNGTIEQFLAMNKFTDEDLPSLVKGEIEDTEEAKRLREQFWSDIYESLPHRESRYLRAIVKRKHTSYSKRKKWSTEEDKRLVDLAKEHEREEKKWLHIGKILGRTPTECRDRHRNYALCGTARTIGPWKGDELRLLLRAVSKSVPEDPEAGDLEYGAEHYGVDWMEVSAEMGGRRSRQQCLAKWTKMRVNVNNLRVRRLLHGRQNMTPELRIVLMQVYSTPEDGLRQLVSTIATHVADGDRAIPWRELDEGGLTKDLRVETLNIIWSRLRKGLAKGLRNKSDQECARKMYDSIDEQDLEKVVAEQEDIEFEEEIMSDPPKSVSTRTSFAVGKSG